MWSYAGGTHDPSLRRHGGRESLHRSSPTQVGRKVFGGDAVEAPEPFLQSAMVSVHVVDVIFRRLRLRIARRGQNVDIELGAPRERVMADPPSQQKSVEGAMTPPSAAVRLTRRAAVRPRRVWRRFGRARR